MDHDVKQTQPNPQPKTKSSGLTPLVVETVVIISAYTIACRIFGFRMVKPSHMKDGVLVVRTIGGRLLKSSIGG